MPTADDITPVPEPPAAEPEPPAGPPPGMPPADESGFPMLPMFGGEVGELFGSLSAGQTVIALNTSLRDGVMTSATAMLGENGSQAQVGTQLVTSRGTLKAELVSQGMLQTTLEGLQPLPFLNMNLQLAFVPSGLAGGVLQSMILTPVGMVMTALNTGGQMSVDVISGAQPTPTSQVMLGCHWWGLPGLLGGCKAALEVQHMVMDEQENPVASSAITMACTAPFVTPDGTKVAAIDPTVSLSVFQRLAGGSNTLAATIERTPKATHMTAGGTRQLSESARVRGKWGTQGVLALALEVAGDKSSLTLVSEVNSSGALNPKFGATLSLSP